MKEYHSYGVILLKKNTVLMVCRKDSIGFCEFIKGKYKTKKDVNKLVSFMTKNELKILCQKSFEDAYKKLWNTLEIDYTKKYILRQKEKFENYCKLWYPICFDALHNGNFYYEAEWGFPKGKKEYNETEIEAALRELKEETQIDKSMIKILNKDPLLEIRKDGDCKFISNYYIAYAINEEIWETFETIPQKNEIIEIRFVKIKDSHKLIRPYFKERIDILSHLIN